ncbi:podoplanin [Genypterus blacodes]|uniref:podoplanin n=1 Tax=Genypterus blacodes TaxID=154954 RepID=UPI003F75E388
MKVQLLLLVALLGSFCALTRAFPTVLPEELRQSTDAATGSPQATTGSPQETTESTAAPNKDLSVTIAAPLAEQEASDAVITFVAPTPTEPVVKMLMVSTDAATGSPRSATEAEQDGGAATKAAPEAEQDGGAATEATTAESLVTEATAVAATAKAAPQITDATAVVTEAPAAPEVHTPQAEVIPVEAGEQVIVENDEEESLTPGQIAGIVIGALLSVGIVIVVVIAAVRRMGKYSP